MKLEEAIETLMNIEARDLPEEDNLFKGYAKAIQLGIEALELKKRLQIIASRREHGDITRMLVLINSLLPSETEE